MNKLLNALFHIVMISVIGKPSLASLEYRMKQRNRASNALGYIGCSGAVGGKRNIGCWNPLCPACEVRRRYRFFKHMAHLIEQDETHILSVQILEYWSDPINALRTLMSQSHKGLSKSRTPGVCSIGWFIGIRYQEGRWCAFKLICYLGHQPVRFNHSRTFEDPLWRRTVVDCGDPFSPSGKTDNRIRLLKSIIRKLPSNQDNWSMGAAETAELIHRLQSPALANKHYVWTSRDTGGGM